MKEKIKKYLKYLDEEAKKFKLTGTDLDNLCELGLMLPSWFIDDLKTNKMDKWFNRFFGKIEGITLRELKEYDNGKEIF